MKGQNDLLWAFALTLLVHAGIAMSLDSLGDRVRIKQAKRVEVEIVAPPPPPSKPPPPPVVPEVVPPVPEPPPLEVPDKPPPKTPTRTTATTTKTTTTEPPPTSVAPGPVTGDSVAAPVVTIPDLALPSGSGPAVAVGRPTTRKVGSGGTGTSTGGGGTDPKGETRPAPVSIASIKKRALPIGDTDYFDAGRDYPAEARRREIEGAIKVRLVVDAEGKVTERKLVTRLGFGLDELALELASKLRFTPAIDSEDRAVASVVVWTFQFRLPD